MARPREPLGAPPVDFVVRAFGVPVVTRPDDPAPDLRWRGDQSVHTGIYCTFTPDPIAPVAWQL